MIHSLIVGLKMIKYIQGFFFEQFTANVFKKFQKVLLNFFTKPVENSPFTDLLSHSSHMEFLERLWALLDIDQHGHRTMYNEYQWVRIHLGMHGNFCLFNLAFCTWKKWNEEIRYNILSSVTFNSEYTPICKNSVMFYLLHPGHFFCNTVKHDNVQYTKS